VSSPPPFFPLPPTDQNTLFAGNEGDGVLPAGWRIWDWQEIALLGNGLTRGDFERVPETSLSTLVHPPTSFEESGRPLGGGHRQMCPLKHWPSHLSLKTGAERIPSRIIPTRGNPNGRLLRRTLRTPSGEEILCSLLCTADGFGFCWVWRDVGQLCVCITLMRPWSDARRTQ